MIRIKNGLWLAVVGAMAVALLSSAVLGDTVRLKRVVAVEGSGPVLLGTVAELDGEYAVSLRDRAVVADVSSLLRTSGSGELTLADLRSALRRDGVDVSRLAFSGASCVLRGPEGVRGREKTEDADHRERGTVVARRDRDEGWRTLADWQSASERTVEIAIVERMASELAVAPDRLRLRFDERGNEALGLTVGSQRTVIEMLSKPTTSVVMFRVERYRANGSLDRVISLRVEAQVLRRVARVQEAIGRGQVLRGEMLETVEEWISPTVDALDAFEVMGAAGLQVQTRLGKGDLVLRTHVQEPPAVGRNSPVNILYHGDGFVLRTSGRTRQEGRVGELIEVRLDVSNSVVLARVDGPGRVVVVQTGVN